MSYRLAVRPFARFPPMKSDECVYSLFRVQASSGAGHRIEPAGTKLANQLVKPSQDTKAARRSCDDSANVRNFRDVQSRQT